MARVIVTQENLQAAKAKSPPGKPQPGLEGAPATRTPASPAVDGKLERVFKLIPVEVTTFYAAAVSLLAASTESTAKYGALVTLALGTIMIPLVIKKSGEQHDPPVTPHLAQYVFSLLAFWAWAFAIRDPLIGFDHEIPKWLVGLALLAIPSFGGILLQDKKS